MLHHVACSEQNSHKNVTFSECTDLDSNHTPNLVVVQIQNHEGGWDQYIFADHLMTDLRHPIYVKNAYFGKPYPDDIDQKLKPHKYDEKRMKLHGNNCMVDMVNYFLTDDFKGTTFIAFNSSRKVTLFEYVHLCHFCTLVLFQV